MFDIFKDNHDQVNNDQHEGKFSHEVVAGAASFAAMKVFEDRQRKEGKTVNHAFAKEALAAFAGGEADKLFETKGYDEHYGQQDQWTPDSRPPF
ncbi:hypothetical protein SBY92_002443 [Candida maltosa Xu316]